jgi:serine protease Do
MAPLFAAMLSHVVSRCVRGRVTLVLLAIGFAALAPVHAEDLRDEVLTKLRKATFEVVLEKPKTDSLSYEKELPFDLLPFRSRNDKYQPIGTAFALDGGNFVSAAHVVGLGSESVRRRIHLRDSDGKIIRLDRIVKFSTTRDFVVFTVKDYRPSDHLEALIADMRKTDKVFAVGNALGEGVIARDGLYTSDTPEEEDGRWNWIRFSAATSPGNSGGPLVDRDGRAIGVVLRKSQNENLNYALPMREILNASGAKAEIRAKMIFKLDITDRTIQNTLDEKIDLPLGYMQFGHALQQIFNRFTVSLSEQFKAAHREDMFPLSAGAQGLLYRTNSSATFPHVVARQRDGTWDTVLPSERRQAEIGRNGHVAFGHMGNFLYMKMQAPEGVTMTQLHSDSKLFMDLLLRGLYFNRSFGAERVRVTSLGRAKEEAIHVDAYQRKWQVRRWSIEHSDETVVTYALPVPGGYAILMNAADEAASFMFEVDMKTLVDFVFVTYYGTLKQWSDFLSAKDMLPAAFSSIVIEPSYGKGFRYRSKRLSLSYPDELMKVTENSDLHLRFSYFKENGSIIWDVSSVLVGEDKDTTAHVSLGRHIRPPETLADSERTTWESLVNSRMPYTGTAFFEKSHTVIAGAHRPHAENSQLSDSSTLYSIVYAADGSQDSATMEGRLKRFRAGVLINER